MAFTAADVKKLREMTNVGMMDCKKALTETDGDMDKAVEWLREKGLAKAAKKAGRIAAEGMAYATVCEKCAESPLLGQEPRHRGRHRRREEGPRCPDGQRPEDGHQAPAGQGKDRCRQAEQVLRGELPAAAGLRQGRLHVC